MNEYFISYCWSSHGVTKWGRARRFSRGRLTFDDIEQLEQKLSDMLQIKHELHEIPQVTIICLQPLPL